MFADEERELVLESWYLRQQFKGSQEESNMDYVHNSIAHDVDESVLSMASSTSSGTEAGEPAQGPRKISPRPWLMAPKNMAVSRVIALPVTAVTAAAIFFYSRDSISAGAAKFDMILSEDSQDSVRKFMFNARSSMTEKLLTTRFPSSSTSFAQLHGANPSWDKL